MAAKGGTWRKSSGGGGAGGAVFVPAEELKATSLAAQQSTESGVTDAEQTILPPNLPPVFRDMSLAEEEETITRQIGNDKLLVYWTGGETLNAARDTPVTDRFTKAAPIMYMAFEVNKGFDRGGLNTPSNAGRIAIAALQEFKQLIKKMPDGQLVNNTPYDDDGLGSERARLYRKIGFGKLDEGGDQWAVVRNGKLIPLPGNLVHKYVNEE